MDPNFTMNPMALKQPSSQSSTTDPIKGSSHKEQPNAGLQIQPPLSNILKASNVIDKVLSMGIRDFCLCAGARNSPFISLLDENNALLSQLSIQLYHFFDERAAGFFALGCARRQQRPVAIITTSGTAVAELLPAVIEAYYTKTPLILITADRPTPYRGTGAPQSIEQIGIFSHYTPTNLDLSDSLEPLKSLLWDQQTPLHLNICLDEPLLDENIPQWSLQKLEFILNQSPGYDKKILSAESKNQEIKSLYKNNSIPPSGDEKNPAIHQKNASFFSQCKYPLFIISGLSDTEKCFVLDQLKDFPGVWWVESLSGLRGHPFLEAKRIKSGYPFLLALIHRHYFDGVIRVGAVPTTRLWRDLEDKLISQPVLSLSNNPFSGLARFSEQLFLHELKNVCDFYRPRLNQPNFIGLTSSLWEQDADLEQQISSLLKHHPRSQLSLVKQLSSLVREQPLYLGNSLPLREWDMVAQPFVSESVSGNRGANGIDGQLSTFFGWRSEHTHSWALLGDLTTLYDLNAPWILSQQRSQNWTLAVMNNSGGQIFKPMFGREAFLNRHNLNFQSWAQMWNLTYHCTGHDPNSLIPSHLSTPPQILELIPSEEESASLYSELDKLWKTL